VKALCICGEPDSTARPYRVDYLVQDLASLGVESSWMSIPQALQKPAQISTVNLLILWRTAWDGSVAEIVRTARRNSATVVFDADDLVIEPELARIGIIDGIRTQQLSEVKVEQYFRRTLAAFDASDFAFCSTEEIAGYMRARHKTTFVLANGFDDGSYARAREAILRRRETPADALVRVGYATGTRTHQRDFAIVASALANVLRSRPQCRLVLFRGLLDLSEFEQFRGLDAQVEWRTFVPHEKLPDEMGSFDINIAPLEVGNPFCESKSELKFVQAGLLEICTIASPTGPFRRAIRHGDTGFLADRGNAWTSMILRLVDDDCLRRRVGGSAHEEVVSNYGPSVRRERIREMLRLWKIRPRVDATPADDRC
jgi:glycosyltransferase involved in cell wall biosynthesis